MAEATARSRNPSLLSPSQMAATLRADKIAAWQDSENESEVMPLYASLGDESEVPTPFSLGQQRARIQSGIGRQLPEVDAGAYQSDDDDVQLEDEEQIDSYSTDGQLTVGTNRGASTTAPGSIDDTLDQGVDQAVEIATEKTRRWIAKILGHGGNTADTADAGTLDFAIVWILTFTYNCLRFVTTIFVPSRKGDRSASNIGRKLVRSVLPAYKWTEPGDILFFIFQCIIAGVIITFISVLLLAVFLFVGGAGLAGYKIFESLTGFSF